MTVVLGTGADRYEIVGRAAVRTGAQRRRRWGRRRRGEIGGGLGVNDDMPNIGPRISIYSPDSRGDLYVGEVSFTSGGNRYKGQPAPPGLRSLQKLCRVRS